MFSHPAIVVHGLEDARAALRPGVAVLLVSAPGAAVYAGAGWWRAVVAAAMHAYPATPCNDLLDCADAPGRAMAALRAGCRALVLDPACPGFAAVAAAAASLGAVVLDTRPPAMTAGRWSAITRHGPPDLTSPDLTSPDPTSPDPAAIEGKQGSSA